MQILDAALAELAASGAGRHPMPSYFATERLTQRGDRTSRSSGALTRVRLARKQISKYANVMTGI
jgi:hypothetical protein